MEDELEITEILKKIGLIGVHEHFRDNKWAYKCTIEEGLVLAEKYGFLVVCDMPNTEPPVISRERFEQRLEMAKRCNSRVKYMAWFGVTVDPVQIEEAVLLWNNYPEIVGFKMFAGQSTGSLAIISRKDQKTVYETLARLGYTGSLAVHCEDESLIEPEWYNPKKPGTWALARPKEAEIVSIGQQIRLIKETGFSGHLHVCHVSCPESVQIINNAKKEGMNITCGITPHMLLYSVEQMNKMDRLEALFLKCNPPIRIEANRLRMIQCLREGKIDVIETDHAPHTKEDKLRYSSSGAMSIPMLPELYKNLLAWGFEKWQIEDLLRNNALKTFIKIQI